MTIRESPADDDHEGSVSIIGGREEAAAFQPDAMVNDRL
jgi:hypothetical protein